MSCSISGSEYFKANRISLVSWPSKGAPRCCSNGLSKIIGDPGTFIASRVEVSGKFKTVLRSSGSEYASEIVLTGPQGNLADDSNIWVQFEDVFWLILGLGKV